MFEVFAELFECLVAPRGFSIKRFEALLDQPDDVRVLCFARMLWIARHAISIDDLVRAGKSLYSPAPWPSDAMEKS